MHLEHQNTLITGGSSGIGLQLSKQLLAGGNTVTILDRQPPLEALPDARFVQTDLQDPLQIERAINSLQEQVSILVNNAGLMARGEGLLGTQEQDVRNMFGVNVLGSWSVLHHGLKQEKIAPSATILQVCSTVARMEPQKHIAVYQLTKVVVDRMIALLREELPGRRIKVAYPGPVETPMTTAGMTPEAYRALVRAKWGTNVTAEELSEMLVQLLASDVHDDLLYDPATRTYSFQ